LAKAKANALQFLEENLESAERKLKPKCGVHSLMPKPEKKTRQIEQGRGGKDAGSQCRGKMQEAAAVRLQIA